MRAFGLVAAALLWLSPRPGLAQPSSTPAAELNAACRAPGRAVDEAGFVRIGGIQQWVVVEGQDCANPVVLIVHGGPGNPNTPFAHTLFGAWTKDFTVVQWDQRGAGKTYGANPPAEGEPLSIERLADDGVEVARYLTQRLGKRKVILMGGSWGSALAVHIAQAQPDLFHAYVGTAQLVSYADDVKASYERTLSLARGAGDAETIGKLEALGPPPWTNPRGFGVLRRATRKYEALKTDPPPADWFKFAAGYDTPAYEAAYEAGEDYSFLQFVGMAGDGMGPRLDLRKLGTRFEMPVFLLQGDEDLVTPPEISRAYFDTLTAPAKLFVRLPRTGHDPNRTMIDGQLEVLESRVRSAAMKTDKSRR
ncbi:alpha/beta fold hydrolase [Caulobacter sp. UNC279MFTsu5.1]|uniref:alpha/beta fold hydrolase n=1 Tax=Caulobacter sp. UNC279MFTsu5.1 TaxID=1502775 RepID=UPI0008EA1BED|nr:alpha/beta hydrolase [Caulobacter sp. UNC279MFTsu5.1]SFJ12691.1 Pimeloyl-ACP methyl ester carboxylesterase [Caulobacter sp. UNC279MFTsu5.1]